jgi:hypothetical protein
VQELDSGPIGNCGHHSKKVTASKAIAAMKAAHWSLRWSLCAAPTLSRAFRGCFRDA